MTRSFKIVITIQFICYAITLYLLNEFFNSKDLVELIPNTLIVVLPFFFSYYIDEIYNFVSSEMEEENNHIMFDILIIKSANVIMIILFIEKYLSKILEMKKIELRISYLGLICNIGLGIVSAIVLIKILKYVPYSINQDEIKELKYENERLEAKLYSLEKILKDALKENKK